MRLTLFVLLALTIWLGTARAQLVFAHTTLELYPAPQADSAKAVYTFHNAGAKPVHIAMVKSSCDCTVPSLAKQDFAPGEEGEVEVIFTFHKRSGTQEKYLQVISNAPGHPAIVLTLRVTIPMVLDLDPMFAEWRRGDPPAPHAIDVTILLPDPVHVTLGKVDRTHFACTLETLVPGRHDRITITPASTAVEATVAIPVETDYTPHAIAFAYTAHAGVLPPASATAP